MLDLLDPSSNFLIFSIFKNMSCLLVLINLPTLLLNFYISTIICLIPKGFYLGRGCFQMFFLIASYSYFMDAISSYSSLRILTLYFSYILKTECLFIFKISFSVVFGSTLSCLELYSNVHV